MKKKTWIRFLKTYLSFIVCSILIMIPIYIRYYKILQENESNISSILIKNGMNLVDNQILSLINLSQATYADSRYRLILAQDTAVPVSYFVPLSQIQSNFKSLISTQTLVSDAGILLSNGIYFTRYRNYFNTDLQFYNTFFTYGELDAKSWNDLLFSNASGGFLPATQLNTADYDSYEAITYVCAWPSNYPKSFSGILYATIKVDDLLSQLVTKDILEDGYVMLYDSQDNLLINYQHHESNKNYQVISYEGPNMKIEVGIPNSLISKRLAPIRKILMFYMFGLTMIAILLASFFAYRNFNPIRKLVGIISHTPNAPHDQFNNLDEYDLIANAVTSLDQKVDTFARTIETQKDIIRVHLFEKALSEGLHSRLILNEFSNAFPDFPEYYQLASLNFSIQGDAVLETLLSLYEEISDNLSSRVYMHVYRDSAIILLLPLNTNSPEDFWEIPLKKLHSLLTEKYDLDSRIALSERFEENKRLTEAYSQIRSIDLLTDGQNSLGVLQLKDFPQRSTNLALDFSSMQQLYDALRLGDMESTQSILDTNLKSIHNTGYVDEMIIKQIYLNFRSILLRVKLENYDEMLSIEIPAYVQSVHVRKLFDNLSICCKDICLHISKLREFSKNRFYESVCTFILENFTNTDLYAKMVANQFGISETTLQKIVQSTIGKTFFEYVEDLRLDKAYQMLKSTSFTVQLIATDCGFSSQNSFYKAFKRRYNQSPGSLR